MKKYLDLNDYAAEREAMILAEWPHEPSPQDMEIIQHRARMHALQIVKTYPVREES